MVWALTELLDGGRPRTRSSTRGGRSSPRGTCCRRRTGSARSTMFRCSTSSPRSWGHPSGRRRRRPSGSCVSCVAGSARRRRSFVLSWSLGNGWQLFAPGLAAPIAQYGEEGFPPVLAEPLPVAEPDRPAAGVYLHVILDEAQDLSPMEYQMIARRAAHASMTTVGDLGQATHPLAAGSWSELVRRLGKQQAHPRPADRVTGAAGHRGLRRPCPGAGDRAHPLVPARRHPEDPAGRRPRRGGGAGARHGRGPRPPGRRPALGPGQPGQGPGVRPGGARGARRHRRGGTPRHEPALRRPDQGRAVAELVILHTKPLPDHLTA